MPRLPGSWWTRWRSVFTYRSILVQRPKQVQPLPPPGTVPGVIVPLPYPSVPAARPITVSPDGLDVFVASTAGFQRSIPYLTGFPVAKPQHYKSGPAHEHEHLEWNLATVANVALAVSPGGHTLVAAVAGQGGSETDLDAVAITPDATAPPTMSPPSSPSQILHIGLPHRRERCRYHAGPIPSAPIYRRQLGKWVQLRRLTHPLRQSSSAPSPLTVGRLAMVSRPRAKRLRMCTPAVAPTRRNYVKPTRPE